MQCQLLFNGTSIYSCPVEVKDASRKLITSLWNDVKYLDESQTKPFEDMSNTIYSKLREIEAHQECSRELHDELDAYIDSQYALFEWVSFDD